MKTWPHRNGAGLAMLTTRRRRLGAVAVVGLALVLELVVWHGYRGLRNGAQVPFWVIPALVAPLMGALFLRWRHPVRVFALEWFFALTGLILPGYEPFAGVLVALHAVARRTSTRTAALALMACA